MNKELIDKAWACLPREFKEEVKDIYLNTVVCQPCGYNHKTDLLKYLFGNHNLTSDAEGEEMLTVSRKQIDALKGEIFDAIMDAHDDDDWQAAAHYILDVMPRSFAALFGSKCLPDELNEDNFATKKPQPAEPKFKVGDKVRIVDDSRHGQEYRGYVTEVVYVDESDPDATYKVYMYDEECGVSLWYSESDLEPYTEPKEREENAQERATLTDDCQSQCKSHHIGDANDMIDDIIKNSFREHNRLHIAAQIVAAIYANRQAAKGFKSMEKLVHKALDITDTLIKESEKGG